MNIIDFHTHIFPDSIANRAVSMLAKAAGVNAFLDGTLRDLRRSMTQSGVDKSVILPVSTKPSQVTDINNWASQLHEKDIISFGTLHPDFDAWEMEIDRMRSLGIKGVKFHPDYQNFYIDEERMLPVYDSLQRHGFIVVIHAGEDIGVLPPVHGTPDRIARVLDLVPGIRMVAAHLGGYKMWDQVEKHLTGRNIFLDTSYTLGEIDPNLFKEILYRHGIDKIIFGTDSPWRDQSVEIARLEELSLGQEDKEKIFFRNAEKLLS